MALITDSLTIPPAGSLNATGKSAADRQLPAAASRSVVPLIYGEERISGLVLNSLGAYGAPGTLLVQVLWCFAIDGIHDLRWGDDALPAGVTATHYPGDQLAGDPDLQVAFAAQGMAGPGPLTGYAWSVIRMPAALFDGQLAFTARVRGRRCYDPTHDSTAGGYGLQRLADPSSWTWSDVPAVCWADFLTNPVYGCGQAVYWPSVAVAAAANNAAVPGSAERRRILGVSFTSPAAANDVSETLRAYAGCFLLASAGGLRMLPDTNEAPAVSYRHALGQIAGISALELRDLSQAPTAVEVIYTDTSAIPWRDGSAIATLEGAGTTKPWRLSQVRLPGIHRYGQAMREAVERLNKLQLNDLTTSLEVFDVGIRHDKGDVIAVEHPIGLAMTAMRVTDVAMSSPGRWLLSLVRHSAAAYSDLVLSTEAIQDAQRVVPALADGSSGTMNADPGLLNAASAWEWDASIIVAGPSTAPGALGVKFFSHLANGTVDQFAQSTQTFPISAARTYNLNALLYADEDNDRNMWLVVRMFRADGSELTGADTGWGGSYAGYTFGGLPTPGQWTRYGHLTDFGAGTPRPIPASAAYCKIAIWFQYSYGTSSVQQAAEDIRLVDVTEARAASAAAAAAQSTANGAAASASNALSLGGNLIPNSDQRAGMSMGWALHNGASFDHQLKLASELWSDTYVLLGGSTRNLTMCQLGRVAAGDDLPVADIYPLGGWGMAHSVPVQAGWRMCFSVYLASHRCYFGVGMQFFDAAGNHIASTSGMSPAGPTETGADRLDLYSRQHVIDTVPAGASFARVYVRKFNTQSVSPWDSWIWLAAPMLQVVGATATGPGQYVAGADGGVAVSVAASDAAAKATAARLAAELYAAAQAHAADVAARAYADGKVTAEEERAIADAIAKADAARVAAISAAAVDATSKATAARLTAEAYAVAQANAADVSARAYADGQVDAEEARAIADAIAKANAARDAAIAAAAADAAARVAAISLASLGGGAFAVLNKITSLNVDTLIDSAAINYTRIGVLQAGNLSVVALSDTINGGVTSTGRIVVTSNRIDVFDNSNVRRVRLGEL